MRRTTRTCRPSLLRRLSLLGSAAITVVVFGIVSLFGVPAAGAALLLHAGNVVGVIGQAGGQRVGAHEPILAGQGRQRSPGYDVSVVGFCVAAESAPQAKLALATGGAGARSGGPPCSNFDVAPYRPSNDEFENHHGILDVWSRHNVPGYRSRAGDNPTVVLTPAQHAATTAAYRGWLTEQTGSPVGGKVDWTSLSARDAQAVSERMFDAAGVPAGARARYYSSFTRYAYGSRNVYDC